MGVTGNSFVMGFDPGLSGALALLDGDGKLVDVQDMPIMIRGTGKGRTKHQVNAPALAHIIRSMFSPNSRLPIHAVVEHVSAMPGQGVSSMFSMGDSFGVIRGVLAALEIPMETVHPRRWKKHFRLLGSDKDAARTMAIQLYPYANLALKKHIGRADAILIARMQLLERSES